MAWLKKEWEINVPSHIITEAAINTYNTNNFGVAEPDYDPQDWPTLDADDAMLDAHRVDEAWSFLSRIRLDDTDYFKRIYTVESCSYYYGRPVTVTKAAFQNETFADFALYISDWDNDFIFTMIPNGIQGPVHTNGFPRLSAGSASYWDATKSDGSPQDPWVSGPLARITHAGTFKSDSTDPVNTLGIAGDGLQYANGNSYTAGPNLVPFNSTTGAPIASRYEKIVSGGRENISQTQEIPMPTSNVDLRQDAWGGTLPANNTAWNAAVNGAGTVLVNTSTGHPNDPNGEVSGGIFIRGGRADDMLLDITPEGNQKIRVRQGEVTVADPSNDTWRAQVTQYHRPVVHPAWDEENWVCSSTATHMVDTWELVHHSQEVTQANGSRCGYHQEFIPGPGGISQPIDVPNVCTYTEEWDQWEVTGQHEEEYCANWSLGTPTHHPEWTEWVACAAGDPGAEANGSTWQTVPEGTPGAERVAGTRNIENWNSVVEVNDNDYHIPFYSGMKINGEVITDPSDSRLTVSDGHTVTIKNDYSDGTRNYQEYTVLNGRTNGVVFSDVDVRGLRGTNKGAKYEDDFGNLRYQGRVIAANIGEGFEKNIQIKDSILQYYDGNATNSNGDPINDGHNRLKPGEDTPGPEHILGLIGTNIEIRPGEAAHRYENTDTASRETGFNGGNFQGGINVYGILMAGRINSSGNEVGGFGAHSSAMNNDDNLGDFNLYGGIISATARKTQSFTGGDNNGFRLGLNYDKVAADYLKYFPPTNQYAVLRYVNYPAAAD